MQLQPFEIATFDLGHPCIMNGVENFIIHFRLDYPYEFTRICVTVTEKRNKLWTVFLDYLNELIRDAIKYADRFSKLLSLLLLTYLPLQNQNALID